MQVDELAKELSELAATAAGPIDGAAGSGAVRRRAARQTARRRLAGGVALVVVASGAGAIMLRARADEVSIATGNGGGGRPVVDVTRPGDGTAAAVGTAPPTLAALPGGTIPATTVTTNTTLMTTTVTVADAPSTTSLAEPRAQATTVTVPSTTVTGPPSPSSTAPTSPPSTTPPGPSTTAPKPSTTVPPAGGGISAAEVRRAVAAWQGVPTDRVRVLSRTAVTWPDTSLGCPSIAGLYLPVLTSGHRFEVAVDPPRGSLAPTRLFDVRGASGPSGAALLHTIVVCQNGQPTVL